MRQPALRLSKRPGPNRAPGGQSAEKPQEGASTATALATEFTPPHDAFGNDIAIPDAGAGNDDMSDKGQAEDNDMDTGTAGIMEDSVGDSVGGLLRQQLGGLGEPHYTAGYLLTRIDANVADPQLLTQGENIGNMCKLTSFIGLDRHAESEIFTL